MKSFTGKQRRSLWLKEAVRLREVVDVTVVVLKMEDIRPGFCADRNDPVERGGK